MPVSVISNVLRAGWNQHYANIRWRAGWNQHYANIRRRRSGIMPTLGGVSHQQRNTQHREEEEIQNTEKAKYKT